MIQELDLENLDIIKDSVLVKEEVLNEFQHNPFAKYLVYIEKGEVIGYLYYSDIYERAEINQLEVKLIHRNCGKATKLMEKLIETVHKPITLEVKANNFYAMKLYKKFDFQERAIRRNYYKGIDGILMERNKVDK